MQVLEMLAQPSKVERASATKSHVPAPPSGSLPGLSGGTRECDEVTHRALLSRPSLLGERAQERPLYLTLSRGSPARPGEGAVNRETFPS